MRWHKGDWERLHVRLAALEAELWVCNTLRTNNNDNNNNNNNIYLIKPQPNNRGFDGAVHYNELNF